MALIGVTGARRSWVPVTPSSEGSALKRYDVIIGGNRTTLLLSDADAAARGLVPVADPAPAPTGPVQNGPVPTKAKTPANKSRKPADKDAPYPPIAEA